MKVLVSRGDKLGCFSLFELSNPSEYRLIYIPYPNYSFTVHRSKYICHILLQGFDEVFDMKFIILKCICIRTLIASLICILFLDLISVTCQGRD